MPCLFPNKLLDLTKNSILHIKNLTDNKVYSKYQAFNEYSTDWLNITCNFEL